MGGPWATNCSVYGLLNPAVRKRSEYGLTQQTARAERHALHAV